MSGTLFITFRGEADVPVEYSGSPVRDRETNTDSIEWWFHEPSKKEIVTTDDEDQAIYDAVCKHAYDSEADWDDNVI